MEQVDVCIVGAGVIGLAVGRALAQSGMDVIVLEQGPRIGEGISSRNSEVIHAGIYYPAGSLKAALCVKGKQRLYQYCQSHSVAHARIGKLIVATNNEDESQLAVIEQKAIANGVTDLKWLSASELKKLEPSLQGVAALMSPSTGIISAHELMLSFQGDIESAAGSIALATRVKNITPVDSGFEVVCDSEGDEFTFKAKRLVNSAGLSAQAIAHTLSLSEVEVPQLHYCKGNYFTYQGKSPFSRLIYPVPEASGAGLGVHATLDMGGQLKFGPDVEYILDEDYEVTDDRIESHVAAIRRYFPDLDRDRLVPGYAGIRPKLQAPGEPPADFVIQGPESHGVSGLVNLFGIESPGLTSSMAIAETVLDRLQP